MARNTKPGKESEAAKKLIAEQEATDKAQKAREAEMIEEEAAKLEAAQAESDNQAPPIAEPTPLPDKERKQAWEAFLKAYAEQNPVKFAQKKAAGQFKDIPDSFNGRNQLIIQG